LVGSHVDGSDFGEDMDYVRVPLRLDGESGEVLIAAPRTGEVISPRLAQVLAELIIDQTAVVDRLPNKHELKNKFIHDLLHGSSGDEARLVREAQILGMDLTQPRVVILIDAAEYLLAPAHDESVDPSDARIRRRAQLVIGSVVDFFELPNDTICAYIGHGEIAVLKAGNKQSLFSWVSTNDERDISSPSWAHLAALKRAGTALLTRIRSDTGRTVNVGIGRHHPGLQGLARSYQDARAALSLGRRFHGQNRVHCLDSLGVAAFVGVSDERTKIDLAHYLLSPLDHVPELLGTLDTFFSQDCCPSSSAQLLSIHRNTLSYRLDKIASLTGLDPRRFDDAVQIRLALVLRSLQADPSPANGNEAPSMTQIVDAPYPVPATER
jgi:carbohydrate diacid regulator